MERLYVFIYSKDEKIKALNLEDAKNLGDNLVKDGWVHTQTLDPCVFIEYLHNECENVDLISEIISLRKKS